MNPRFPGSFQQLVLAFGFAACVSAQPTLQKVTEFGGPNQSQRGLWSGHDGAIYGWDTSSDSDRRGSIFRVNEDGSGFATLHAFAGTPEDGDNPGDLIQGSDGSLYGTATDTQARTPGRIFALSPGGNGYRVLKRFDRTVDGTASPFGLLEGSDHTLYGVTQVGGTLGSAKIFKIDKAGTNYQVLYDFEGDVASPNTTFGPGPTGGLIEGSDGRLYGLSDGGSAGRGAVYRLNRDGTGFQIVHDFTGDGQGSGALGLLREASDGFLYGVGNNGGASNQPVVFKLRPDGSAYQVILTAPVGAPPHHRLVESGDGYFYGVSTTVRQFIWGTIYRVKGDGSGFEELHAFSSALGSPDPLGNAPSTLLHASDGYLYCVTVQQTSFVGLGQSQFILVRYGPVALLPKPLKISPSFVPTGQTGEFKLSFTGEPGREYQIQSTDDLTPNWQTVRRISADTQGKVEFTDSAPLNQPTRFFRVAAAP